MIEAAPQEINAIEQQIAQLEQTQRQQQEIVPTGSGKALSLARQKRTSALEQTEQKIHLARKALAEKQALLKDSLPGGRFHEAQKQIEQRQAEQAERDQSAMVFFSTPKPRSRAQLERDRLDEADSRLRANDEKNIERDIRGAQQIVSEQPDLMIHIVDDSGNVTKINAASLLDEVKRDTENAHHDASLFEVAINCFLRSA